MRLREGVGSVAAQQRRVPDDDDAPPGDCSFTAVARSHPGSRPPPRALARSLVRRDQLAKGLAAALAARP